MRLVLAVVVVAAAASSAHAAQAPADGSADAAEIRAQEHALVDAIQARDRARIEQLLWPDYVLRGVPDIARAEWVQNAVTLCWGRRSNIDDFETRRQGDVVVATFELTFYVDPLTCRDAVLRSLITDVWSRRDGEWRLQLRHAAPPPAAGAGPIPQYGSVPLPPAIWDVSSELSLVATGGNTSTRTIGLGGALTHRTPSATTRATLAFLTSETDGITRARALTMQGRHGIRLGRRVDLFGQGTYARDQFAGVDHRATISLGAALKAPLPPRHALAAEGSFGFTSERRLDSDKLDFVTGTAALTYVWTMRAGVTFSEDLAFIADVESAGNWRGTSATAIFVTMTRLLSFKASHAIEYRHAPVAGFGPTDMRTAAALVVSLQRRPPVR